MIIRIIRDVGTSPRRIISEAGHVRTLADLISLIYFYHTIAHTNMCLDVLRGLLCWLQLFPQCCHKYPQRSYIVIPTAAPDILCDKGMGQYLANIVTVKAGSGWTDMGQ